MMFQVFFMLFLGTVYTFSSWANLFIGTRSNPGLGLPGSPGPFPTWHLSDLDSVYSMGILGAFSMPVGGYFHDRFGTATTLILGLALMLSGFAAMYATAATTIVPEHWKVLAVGLGYFVEEAGSCTLYMAIALDTLATFPKGTVATSMAIVSISYTVSAILTSVVMLFMQPTLWQFFGFIAVSASVCTCIRLVLGGAPQSKALQLEAAGIKQEESYCTAMSTPEFFHLWSLHVLILPSCTALLGLIKVVGNAGGIDGSMLAMWATVGNVMGGMLSGAVYDKFQTTVTSTDVILLLETGFVIVFGIMTLGCRCDLSMTVASSSLVIVFLFGAVCPLCSVYVKENFADGAQGLMWGLTGFALAVTNFVFMRLVIPASVRSLSDLSDAMTVSTLLTATCALALAVHQQRPGRRTDKKAVFCDVKVV